jgi:hypothetical protein
MRMIEHTSRIIKDLPNSRPENITVERDLLFGVAVFLDLINLVIHHFLFIDFKIKTISIF